MCESIDIVFNYITLAKEKIKDKRYSSSVLSYFLCGCVVHEARHSKKKNILDEQTTESILFLFIFSHIFI